MYRVIVETISGRRIEEFEIRSFMYDHPEIIGRAIVGFIEKAEKQVSLLTRPVEIQRVEKAETE